MQTINRGSCPILAYNGDISELYRLYVSALQRAHDWILQSTPKGQYQSWLLQRNRIVPKEYFEARLASIARDRRRFDALVQALRESA